MNKQTVGMENLPNVFIDKINVLTSDLGNRTQFNIKVTLMMVDDELNKSWFGKIDDLKIKCSFVSNEKIQQLNSGVLSLYDFSPGFLNATFVESCDEFELYKTESGYDYYRKSISFSIIDPSNLNVYVSAFIDDLGFGIPLFDKFYGPMSAEKIVVASAVNAESGYFYYPDTNEEYGGPVHAHNQRYMEGSQHSDNPHSRLVYVIEENYKITSNVQFDLLDRAAVAELFATDIRNESVDPNYIPENFPGPSIPTPTGTTFIPGGYS
mgnify:CR=1 FL=1